MQFKLATALSSAVLIFALAAGHAHAQGGPPMITDDPGTPGHGHWEINLAVIANHQSEETILDLPAIDLNYGLGDQIQLTLETAPVLLKRNGHGPVGGVGGTEAALKWRFLDAEHNGVDVSVFPRVIFNTVQSSVRRGLTDAGTRVQWPVQVAKKLGPVHVDLEFGPRLSTVGRGEWLYGIVGAIDATKTTALMAELNGSAYTSFDKDVLTVNVGVHQKLNDRCALIASIGHDIRSSGRESLALLGYCGVQLTY